MCVIHSVVRCSPSEVIFSSTIRTSTNPVFSNHTLRASAEGKK
ncbi:Uncharacterised protein [Vibrio cholerae]|nr:Uncharacterised protein [Vibrio cholerae]